MLKKNVYSISKEIMKIHRIIRQLDRYFSVQQFRPASSEEVIYLASICLELKKKEMELSHM